MSNKPQPADFEIHAPRDWKFVEDAKGFQVWVESEMTKQRYHLRLEGPMFTNGKPRPANVAEVRGLLADECALVSIFLQRKAVEFSTRDHFICGVRCTVCDAEIVHAPAAQGQRR